MQALDYTDYFPSAPDVVTPEEVADMLRVDPATVHTLLTDTQLAYLKLGKKVVVPKAFYAATLIIKPEYVIMEASTAPPPPFWSRRTLATA